MAYQQIQISNETPKNLDKFIREHIDMQFGDVHCMLRLPIPEAGLTHGCNFAATSILLSLVSGLSTIFYKQEGAKGERFKGLLGEYYPWDLQPSDAVPVQVAITCLYDLVRNPLVHALGVFTRDLPAKNGKRQGVVVAPKTRIAITKGPLSEAQLKQIEASAKAPLATIAAAIGGGYILNVIGLYWGVRLMLTRLTHDAQRMKEADQFLQLRQ